MLQRLADAGLVQDKTVGIDEKAEEFASCHGYPFRC